MSLIEYNLMGEKVDKVQTAINRLQTFEPEEGYYGLVARKIKDRHHSRTGNDV